MVFTASTLPASACLSASEQNADCLAFRLHLGLLCEVAFAIAIGAYIEGNSFDLMFNWTLPARISLAVHTVGLQCSLCE